MILMRDDIKPDNIPTDTPIVGGYLNGRYGLGTDPALGYWHNVEQWQKFSGLWVPIWVYIPGQSINATDDARQAVKDIWDVLGLPIGSTIVLDVEAGDAQIAAGYASAWCSMVNGLGYKAAIYTSDITWKYLNFPNVDFWIADWNSIPHLIDGTVATQHTSLDNYDESLCVDDWPRRSATTTPPVDVVPISFHNDPTEEAVMSFPLIGPDSNATHEVRKVQGLLHAFGYDSLAIDGDYGPLTHAAVMEFQAKFGIGIDGVAGPETMGKLISA